MTWTKPVSDVGSWQPKETKEKILRNSLMVTCQAAQARIVAGANTEKKFRVHNYDSGLGIEEIIREALARLLSNRYSVAPGLISDREGRTAGTAT